MISMITVTMMINVKMMTIMMMVMRMIMMMMRSHRGLPVLDGQLDGDLQSFPVTSCLGNVLTWDIVYLYFVFLYLIVFVF